MTRTTHALLASGLLALVAPVAAQEAPNATDLSKLADDPAMFLAVVRKAAQWDAAVAPFPVAGPVSFVGTRGLGVYLLHDRKGMILINSGMPGSGAKILESVRQLGFDPRRIRYIAVSHAHIDHVGDLGLLRAATGAKVVVLEQERALLADGGASDFHYAAAPAMSFPPVTADRVMHDGDVLALGRLRLTAMHTPGHTRGATSWLLTYREKGATITVLWPDGTGINPGYRLGNDPSYPDIAADYRKSVARLSALAPDIWLAWHNDAAFWRKAATAAAARDPAAWRDPSGYTAYITGQRTLIDQAAR